MAPWHDEEDTRKNIAANRGIHRLFSREDPQLVSELRELFPWIPEMPFTVEMYAPIPGQEEDFPSVQAWLIGEHHVLVSSTDGNVHVRWYKGRVASEFFENLEPAEAARAAEIVGRAILRHRAGGHRVH